MRRQAVVWVCLACLLGGCATYRDPTATWYGLPPLFWYDDGPRPLYPQVRSDYWDALGYQRWLEHRTRVYGYGSHGHGGHSGEWQR